jgi:hypothetical protein
MAEGQSIPKKRVRKPKAPAPLTIVDAAGQTMVLNDPERMFEDQLRATEDDVVRSLAKLLTGPDATAAVTAATKIFAHLEDSDTPQRLRDKLMPLREEAFQCLKEISTGDAKATAVAQANACLLRVMVQKAPAIWPPNTEEPQWKERFSKAVSLASV